MYDIHPPRRVAVLQNLLEFDTLPALCSK